MRSIRKKFIPAERIEQLYTILERLNINSVYINSIKNDHDNKLIIINEALTHTSSNASFNHERLEFLGDAVLRLSSSIFIENNFNKMQVGERSALRSQLVSDKWLSKVGKKIKIEEIFLLGAQASKDKPARDTFQAEATEALIGALYECLQNLNPILEWLSPYWDEETQIVLSDPHRNNPKSALQEWSQKKGLSLPDYEIEELSKLHGNPKRFFCKVFISGKSISEGWGGSRKEAEKKAASSALKCLKSSTN